MLPPGMVPHPPETREPHPMSICPPIQTTRRDPEATPPPVRYCACGNAIGDGRYANGHRDCALCEHVKCQRRRGRRRYS
jgi:hypothetical protein